MLHRIQDFLLDLLHLVLMLEVDLLQLLVKDFHLVQILHLLELVSYLVGKRKASVLVFWKDGNPKRDPGNVIPVW